MVTPTGAHHRCFIYEIFFFFPSNPLAALLSTRPGGERGEVGLRLTRPAPRRSSGPLGAARTCGRAPYQPVSTSPSPPARRTVAGEIGNMGRGRGPLGLPPDFLGLRARWAVRSGRGLCALHLGAPAFPGVRAYFSPTSRLYQSSVTLHTICIFPPLRATGRSWLGRGNGCVRMCVLGRRSIPHNRARQLGWTLCALASGAGRGRGADRGVAGSPGPPGTKGLTLSPPASSVEEGRAPGPDPSPGPALTSHPPPFGVSA